MWVCVFLFLFNETSDVVSLSDLFMCSRHQYVVYVCVCVCEWIPYVFICAYTLFAMLYTKKTSKTLKWNDEIIKFVQHSQWTFSIWNGCQNTFHLNVHLLKLNGFIQKWWKFEFFQWIFYEFHAFKWQNVVHISNSLLNECEFLICSIHNGRPQSKCQGSMFIIFTFGNFLWMLWAKNLWFSYNWIETVMDFQTSKSVNYWKT